MKTTPVCSILASLIATAVAMNPVLAEGPQGGNEGREGPPPRNPAPSKMWQNVDKDGDGDISREEFDGMPRLQQLPQEKRGRLFERLDKNGNGRIERLEIRHADRGSKDRRPPMPRIWELDRDKDGGVDFAEFKSGPMFQKLDDERQQRIFKRLDSNGDGRITPHDKPKLRPHGKGDGKVEGDGRPGRQHPREMFKRMDQDGDGAVSWDEFKSSPSLHKMPDEKRREKFDAADRNGDGVLDRKDFPPRPATQPEAKGPRDAEPGVE